MKYPSILALICAASAHANVIIDGSTNNGGFVHTASGNTTAVSGWTANKNVWVDTGNTTLATSPFGADGAANSHFIQLVSDSGGVFTSTAKFNLAAGDSVACSFDYKTGGSGGNTTLTVSLVDTDTGATFATLGSLNTASDARTTFAQKDLTLPSPGVADNLVLQFTLSDPGGVGKDFHIDRVFLSGGTLAPPVPPAPIDYATLQQLLPDDSDERIVEKAAKLLPRPNQVAWQRQELTFFVHYGPNAFNGVEWGTGTESPSVFNPTALDASQWVREIKNAGGKMVMLVVKHHDGFCLWPSRYTTHNVASSPWLGGAGDLARDVSTACQAQGLKFGVYLSPADLFQIHSTGGYYGNGSSIRPSTVPGDPATFTSAPATGRTPPAGMPVLQYQVDDYNRYFLNQLYELLTDYGPVHEVWFDGANPESGTTQSYNRPAWYDLIRQVRPEAVIAVKGPDVRWVGNESGVARTTEWSPLPVPVTPDSYGWNDMTATDLGSRAKLTRGSYLTWYPAEVDVPVLNGWFWSASKSPRTASQLLDIYFTSVGRNSNLLLNLSPDTRGLVPDNQLAPLRSLSQVLGQTFAANLAAGSTATAGSAAATRPASQASDSNLDTWWEPAAGQTTGTFTLTLPTPATFDIISLQEAVAQRGQRIESLAVDTWQSGAWAQATTATTVGHKRLLKLSAPLTSDRVRIRILQSRLEPTLAEVSLHRLADLVAEPSIARNTAGMVTLAAGAGESIRYTLDGSEPVAGSPLYAAPFTLPQGGTVKAVAWRANGSHSLPSTRSFGIAPGGWVATADTEQGTHPAAHAVDGDASTYWQTAVNGSGASGPQPHWLKIDMTAPRWIRGFTYLPRQDGTANGIVSGYRCEASLDGATWTTAAEGTFSNIKNNPVEQTAVFAQPVRARWLRFVSLVEVNGATFASAAEIGVLAGGYDGWRSGKGLPPETGAGDRAAWREYALGNLPGGDTVYERPAAGHAGLRFMRPQGIPDVNYALEACFSLVGPWQTVMATQEIQPASLAGMESVLMVEASPPADDRRFYRLRYSWNP